MHRHASVSDSRCCETEQARQARNLRIICQSEGGDTEPELVVLMRIELKPAAILAATVVGLLIIFGAVWPGPGVWLLAVALVLCAAAAGLWFWESSAQSTKPRAQAGTLSSVVDVTSNRNRIGYAPSGSNPRGLTRAVGVPATGLVAAVGAFALILYVGAAIGGSASGAQDTNPLGANVDVIDRSATGAGVGFAEQDSSQTQAGTLTPGSQQFGTSSDSAAASTTTLRPIVVKDPSGATPVSQRGGSYTSTDDSADVAERPAAESSDPETKTFTYVIEPGDTLWDIAHRFDVAVSVLADLNGLTSADIRAGDELMIPGTAE